MIRVARYGRAARRWAVLLARPRQRPGLRVSYGWDRVPAAGEPVGGATVKLQRLASRFPNRPADFTLLYLASNQLPPDLAPQLWLARRRRIPVVVNQDGVGYRAWAGERADAVNRPLRRALLAADHVVYQSAFAKESADRFLGEARAGWEILHNAVDVDHFSPAAEPPGGPPTILLGGDQTQAYRLELALRTLAALRASHGDARLLVAGRLVADPAPLAAELGLDGAVELVGRYAQRDAPALYRRAHVLLHTKVNDPCPNVVIEAMASGVPVVYAASGGTAELVEDEAGVGVPHPLSWEEDRPPDAEALAAALARVLEGHPSYAAAARRRAEERFALEPWLARHEALFRQLAERT